LFAHSTKIEKPLIISGFISFLLGNIIKDLILF